MNPNSESENISLAVCRKILNQNGKKYTDEQILKIRAWIFQYAEMTVEFLNGKTSEEITELEKQLTKKVKNINKGNKSE